MPFRPDKPVRVQPYFGYRSDSRLVLSARALRSADPRFEAKGRWQAFRTMLSQFASHEEIGVRVTLEYESASGTVHREHGETDTEGFVHFDLDLPAEPLPERTAWDVVALKWENAEGPRSIEGYVLAPSRKAGIAVISDIDDTIIETGITGNFRSVLRNWNRVLAQMPEERLHVPGADAFYGALGGGRVGHDTPEARGEQLPATHRPFFYVSSSPWNLFSYLVAFKRQRGLPLGPIKLRDWGLDRDTFGSSSHGSHKREAIDSILELYPDMRFALIGDDTQGDLTAFGKIAVEMPERIAAVFIRQAGEALSAEEEAAREAIREAGVPLWMGDDYSTGEAFLAEAGLAHDADAKAVVETVEKRDVPAA